MSSRSSNGQYPVCGNAAQAAGSVVGIIGGERAYGMAVTVMCHNAEIADTGYIQAPDDLSDSGILAVTERHPRVLLRKRG
jgi:hypothetical protein